jgi:SAM-dependent methyltransferase
MRPDIDELQAFYATRLGQLTRRLIQRQIRLLWPDVRGCRVLGLGYAPPFLKTFVEDAERVAVVVPHLEGTSAWPEDGANLVAVGADHELPILDRSIDRALLVHALEGSDAVRSLLREVWRVLADGGEALIVVPNRRGLWCLSEATPFGQGRPFSSGQLKQVLRDSLFAPQLTARAVFVPPSQSRLLIRAGVGIERVGLRWAKRFSGVLLMLARKEIYAAPVEPAATLRRVPAYATIPRMMPAAERVPSAARVSSNRRAGRSGSARTTPVRSAGCRANESSRDD